jgi:hypothetical protein
MDGRTNLRDKDVNENSPTHHDDVKIRVFGAELPLTLIVKGLE